MTTALSKAQLEDFRNHIYYFNECGGNAQGGSQVSATVGNNKVYLLGDSLLEGAYYETGYLKKDLKDKGWQATADASTGRGLRNPGIDKNNNRPGHEQSAFNALKTDENEWQDAGTIVLELGTNESNSNAAFKSDMGSLIDSIQAKNKDANIYWVNLFSDVPQANAYNAIIKQVAADKNLKGVIDTTSIKKSGVKHPNPAGYQKFSKIIADAIGNPPTSSTGGPLKPGVSYTNRMTLDDDGPGTNYSGGDHSNLNSMKANGSYLNADKVNYFVLQTGWAAAHGGIKFGDIAAITYKGKTAYAVYGDNHGSGNDSWGEGSTHLVVQLGGKPPSSLSDSSNVHYTVYPGSRSLLGIPSGTAGIPNVSIPMDQLQAKIDEVGAQVSGGGAPSSGTATESSGDPSCCPTSTTLSPNSNASEDIVLTNDNVKDALTFFVNKGLTLQQAAGIIGNLSWESAGGNGLNPKSYESGGNRDEVLVGGAGFGIAQWTYPTRQQALADFAKSNGASSSDLGIQLRFIWKEMNSNLKNTLPAVKHAKNVKGAVRAFMDKFEGPLIPHLSDREKAAVNYYNQYKDKISGGSAVSATGSGSSNSSCACTTPGDGPSNGKTVVLDPGHGPKDVTATDPESGLRWVGDGGPVGEAKAMWNVAQDAKKSLEKDGYKVILTKEKYDQVATLIDRYKLADKSNADIGVNLHSDSGLGHTGEIYPQKVGLYRGPSNNRVVFKDSNLADLSQKYAESFKVERSRIEGGSVVIKDNDSFIGRSQGGGIEPGNISIIQLLSKKTPWVYNEKRMVGSDSAAQSKYAEAIVASVKKALSGNNTSQTGAVDSNCPSSGSGDLMDTIKQYAWPDYHSAPYLKMKPEYATAVRKAQAAGKYVGGGVNPGVDCGGFVTTVMHDSGIDPNYNSKNGTVPDQESYMQANPSKYKYLGTPSNTSQLQAGDIAIKKNQDHTYIFVGPVNTHPDFHGNSASASWSSTGLSRRTPMASDATDFSQYNWYRPL